MSTPEHPPFKASITANRSEGVAELMKAICEVQWAVVGKVKRTTEGQVGSRRYKYADLADIIDAIAEPMRKVGLVWWSSADDSTITTVVQHADSGEWISSSFKLSGETPQDLGIEYTYGRRYSLQNLLGLVTEEDTDGDRGDKPAKPRRRTAGGAQSKAKPAPSSGTREGPPAPSGDPGTVRTLGDDPGRAQRWRIDRKDVGAKAGLDHNQVAAIADTLLGGLNYASSKDIVLERLAEITAAVDKAIHDAARAREARK